RHGSPFGVGWDLLNVNRLYKNPHADEAVLVSGGGQEEYFFPRAHTRMLNSQNDAGPNGQHGYSANVLALDPSTGEVFTAVQSTSTIARIDPSTAARTPVVTGLTFDGPPMNMAITYVGGVRHFLVALETRLLDVPQTGSARTLMMRPNFWGNPQPFQIV